jgi:hypothetical protein
MASRSELVYELKTLRKGRGLAGHVEDRVGPFLRSAAGVAENDGAEAIRTKVSARLSELAADLPDDLRLAVLAAFAIEAEARQPLYQDRVRWAAMRLDRDPRTVRRRVDEAIELLAELSVTTPTSSAISPLIGGWHTVELRAWMAVGRSQAERFELRTIVADSEEISSVSLALSGYKNATSPNDIIPDYSTVNIFQGGILRDQWMESSDRIGMTLELPHTLHRRERHQIALRFESQNEPSFYICTPRAPCEYFEVSVRFNDHVPEDPMILDGAFQRDATDPGFQGTPLRVDKAGEIRHRFRNLVPGLAYGLRWSANSRWGAQSH